MLLINNIYGCYKRVLSCLNVSIGLSATILCGHAFATPLFDDGTVEGDVYGGISDITQISDDKMEGTSGFNTSVLNQVNIHSETVGVNQSSIIVDSSNNSIAGNVYGGYAVILGRSGNATAADTDGSGSPRDRSAYAYTHSTVQGDNSTVEANNNVVSIAQTVAVGGSVYGGRGNYIAQSGNAVAGSITGNINYDIDYGSSGGYTAIQAWGDKVRVNGNAVNIAQLVSVSGDVYGGQASYVAQSGKATSGHVGALAPDTNSWSAIFSSSNLLEASNNTINIGPYSVVNGDIYGGQASQFVQSGDAMGGNASTTDSYFPLVSASAITSLRTGETEIKASNNVVEMSSTGGKVYGGKASLVARAGNAGGGNVNVVSTMSSISAEASAGVNADFVTIEANSNVVELSQQASAQGGVYGGYAGLVVAAGKAEGGNATTPVDTTSTPSLYGEANIEASNSTILANNNSVILNGLLKDGSVYGGYAELTAVGGTAISGSTTAVPNAEKLPESSAEIDVSNSKVVANNNTVTLNGTVANGSIYGGYVRFDLTQGTAINADNTAGHNGVNPTNTQVQAINNTVNIGDVAQISGTITSLYGGYLQSTGYFPQNYDVFTGNTLNFSAQPVKVNNLGNFEHYNFTLLPSLANQPEALITANNISLGANLANISDGTTTPSKATVVGIHSGKVLKAGDEFVLMKAMNDFTGKGQGIDSTGVAQQGISLLYDVHTWVDDSNKEVKATILGDPDNGSDENSGALPSKPEDDSAATVNPQLKALPMAYLYSSTLVNRGGDIVAYDTYRTIREQNKGAWGKVPFVIASGNHLRYNVGSNIKANEYLLSSGLSYTTDDGVTTAAFIEGGWGRYDSYTRFDNADNVHADGSSKYYGIGLLARYDLPKGAYLEGSARIGRTQTEFSTKDIVNRATGQFAHYNIKSNYLAGHIAEGYMMSISKRNSLDLSIKYLFSRISSRDVTVAGDPFHFSAINSHRVRLNAEFKHQYSSALMLMSGLGYENEFIGRAKSTTYGVYNIDAPDMEGGTGIGFFGITARPISDQNLSLDVKVNGYTGKREGIGGLFRINYAF
ncbi:autotransporter outer membrane beta-barrel domain-containing protein [Pragia fontium]|uniref:autotransporter outer membrane beta-barrel domain-containing protein n=1 Tax=Pragia fontium TaxID=82985 RepID=UPI000F84DA8C|nr:autotransporter outer membrane beta-barrel domain-containing protein [Pragia fontium]